MSGDTSFLQILSRRPGCRPRGGRTAAAQCVCFGGATPCFLQMGVLGSLGRLIACGHPLLLEVVSILPSGVINIFEVL